MNNLRNQINSCKNPGEFWRAVKSSKFSRPASNRISEVAWKEFYANIMRPTRPSVVDFPIQVHDTLDKDITVEELSTVLSSLKNNKACGTDKIMNEFFSSLPPCSRENLRTIFNTILHDEQIPTHWPLSITSMIFKKGDPSLPVNYRPITLLNASLKIFTKILTVRLSKWA